MLKLRSLDDITNLAGKTVIVRSDLDVPLLDGEVSNNYRIRKAVPTIKHLLDQKAKVVVVGHLGRPEGKFVDDLSLMPVRFELGKLLDKHIKFAHIPNCRNSIKFMEDGEVLMLENVRFHPEEESKDAKVRTKFVEELASLGDYYVNDAFASYRPHASTYDLAKLFKKPIAGYQMAKEVEQLSELRDHPKSPYVAIIGGAKLDTKIAILEKLTVQADYILIGGAMAYTFLKAKGLKVGASKVEDENLKVAEKILKTAAKNKCELMLPIDHVAGSEFSESTTPVNVETQEIPDGLIGLDIGQKTLKAYEEVIKNAKTILWNGPMGVYEWQNFEAGTDAIGQYIGIDAAKDIFKVAGGGDTVAAMDKLKINMKNFNHVSTGGGAMLDFLVGEKFPTLEPLTK